MKAFGGKNDTVGEKREEKDITDRAVAARGAGLAGSEGLAFQSGSELDGSVYSATISDIPSSCPKKSPLKNGSAGEQFPLGPAPPVAGLKGKSWKHRKNVL